MQITIKIEEINYGDVAVRVLPLLHGKAAKMGGAFGKTVYAMSNLPDSLVREMMDAISMREKNEILAAYATEYSDKVLQMLNGLSQNNGIGVMLSDCSMDADLVIRAEVAYIDYPVIVERFLGVIRERLMSMGGAALLLRPMIQGASAVQICNLMDRILGSRKEVFLCSLLNQNQQTLISAIEDAVRQQNIRLEIGSVAVEA